VPLVGDEDCDTGRGEQCYWPVPLRGGQLTSVVQFLHQTVKAFSPTGPWPTHPISDRFPYFNGHAYITKYVLALLFQHRLGDSDVNRRYYLPHDSDGTDPPDGGDFSWHGAGHLSENLLRYVQLGGSDQPISLLAQLNQFLRHYKSSKVYSRQIAHVSLVQTHLLSSSPWLSLHLRMITT
jgi:hypothetical protein